MAKRLSSSEKKLLDLIRINGAVSRLEISKLAGIDRFSGMTTPPYYAIYILLNQ